MIAADQMIRNLSMKIGEVDSGSARLLAAHSNLAEPESTSPIFMLKFLIIWSLLYGVKLVTLTGDHLGGDQSGNHTIWLSVHL